MKIKIIFTIISNVQIIPPLLLLCGAVSGLSTKRLKDFSYLCAVLRDFFSAVNIVHWWKEVSRNERESDWSTIGRKRLFSHVFLFKPWYLSHIPIQNDELYLTSMHSVRHRILTYTIQKFVTIV